MPIRMKPKPTAPAAKPATDPVAATASEPATIPEAVPSGVVPPATTSDHHLAELRSARKRLRKRRRAGKPESAEDRATLRRELVDRGVPKSWACYLAKHGLNGLTAEALARSLVSSSACHPDWFVEAEIAVRRAGLDLATLNYPAVKAAIDGWRSERQATPSLATT